PLMRVILDSRLRLPLDSRLLRDSCNTAGSKATTQDDILVFCSSADETRKAQLEECGIRVEKLPATVPDGRPNLPAILHRLGELEIASVMIEGGATVNGVALTQGVVDKVFLYYAPKILAGTGSIPFATGAGFHRISDAA